MTSRISLPSLAIAIGAGLASALLFASLVGGSMFALPLFVLSALPLGIVAFGWGTRLGVLAAVTATLLVAFALGLPAAIALVLAVALPMPLACHLLGLARPADPAAPVATPVEWYPTGRVLMVLAFVIIGGTVVGGLAIGFDPIETSREVAAAARGMVAGSATSSAEDVSQIEPLVHATVRLMPVFFPASWLMVTVLDLWLAAKVVARSGRLARPAEDLAQVAVPAWAGVAFAASLALAFLDGPIGLVASVIAGALFAVHFLVGMGVLHVVTRGADMRILLLATAYGLVLLFSIPAAAIALVGLLDAHFAFRKRRPPPPAAP
ncbi:hypothetical protein EYW49_05875 [Siculibacillus lacustris]|uniref:DUF2232 domain-containing protein n=1 Tax=Siculibacillus lacustris TaxID=1549641 RepID=A0A4Q9VUF7_9HYPH|nr:hypothetical protein [Siculibacillus lacustris]TBW39785.1 hypothetical protein EYW49_05875 [Siculibacillus lacustris]